MTARARITQDDWNRAVKAAAVAGVRARVIGRLELAEIEVIIGEATAPETPLSDGWDDDDD